MKRIITLMLVTLAVASSALVVDASASPRERLLPDRDWRFAVGASGIEGGLNLQAGMSVDLTQTFGAFSKAGDVRVSARFAAATGTSSQSPCFTLASRRHPVVCPAFPGCPLPSIVSLE